MHQGSGFLGSIQSAFDSCHDLDEILFDGPCAPARGVFSGVFDAMRPVMPSLQDFFATQTAILDWIQDLAAACFTRIDPFFPSTGGNLPGYPARWHAVFPPVVRSGPVFCVRRHRMQRLSLSDFGWDEGSRRLIERQIIDGGAVLVAGACGSGKSSLVAAILREFFCDRRMVIIETYEELAGISRSFINMVARPPNLSGIGEISPAWLFQEALRIRPDGLVIGEIRGSEAAPFLSAVASGHSGCMATIHAGSCEAALVRLNRLCGKAALEPFAGIVVQMAPPGFGVRPAVVGSQRFQGV